MTRCTQPGCGGAVEDGYCTVCGLAPAPAAPSAPAGQGAPSGSAGASGPAGASVPSPASAGLVAQGAARPGTPPGPAAAGSSGPAFSGASFSGASFSGGSFSGGSFSGAAAPGASRTGSTGGTRGTGAVRRGTLGAGLVEVPPVPWRDPSQAVMKDARVAEDKRFCGKCGGPVGRSHGGRRGRPEGFCPACGDRFSFTPKLGPGDLVAGQYEVLGCLAHGGLGWIYLARDRNVSDRWVVLKGLLDSGDADAHAAAAAERATLAEIEHPNIVKIYNFVRHPDPGGATTSGYIVMEYVGGQSLKDVLKRRREQEGPDAALPLGQAIAYALEVLRAFGHLHARGLVYCDLKPDNVIQSEEQLKLIDMGAVLRLKDVTHETPIFGTVGYQAPEIAADGPSVCSDLYTVGRTLAVLSFPFKGYSGTYAHDLPPRHQVPVLSAHESYDRLLRRATHRDPRRRFQSAGEMADQLTGVLREVLAAEDGAPRPAPSTLFGPEQHAGVADVTAVLTPVAAATALPVPLVDPGDPVAGFLAGVASLRHGELATALAAAPLRAPEIFLSLARVRAEQGDDNHALANLREITGTTRGDWRDDWYRAVLDLAEGRFGDARAGFDRLYGELPGEAAPKLALGFAGECEGLNAEAARFYETVWRTDRSYVSAAFGLARVRLGQGDRAGAIDVLDSVPAISSHHVAAQVAAVTATVRERDPADLTERDLGLAGDRVQALKLERSRLAAEVLESALAWLLAGGTPAQPVRLLGARLAERDVRARLDGLYRELARHTVDRAARRALVDRANAVRPRTLL
ncbi:serine/threonine-protein kinase [Bailinhaonella thermotolerans]|uniref:non-specific serine/threonine protein kinase n=1 Tax=Bailinhaonella thermotolerans TaxID=1070861 RepID=A0A3A4B646_9ACTN|nr:serine/threonine-protein kinase [Bailinhaonella thermotolerans]RJL34037.1 serine/threonine protein kinase [Bailinhaonella thermotolerans]